MAKLNYSDNLEQSQETTQHPHPIEKKEYESILADGEKLVARLSELPDGDQIGEVVLNALKMLRDKTNRADLKLLNKSFKELRYALKIFTPYRDTRKVSIFGSARTPETHSDYRLAADFARQMADLGWMVITGAGGGIMAAGHGGAGPDPSFGLAIRLPFEQKTNRYIAKDKKLINFKYFFTRKLMFVRSSHAVTLFPGGFGTMDEGFEVLTLLQTGKAAPLPIALVECPGSSYWSKWDHYIRDEFLKQKLISKEDLALYKLFDNPRQAVEEITNFYRNYHSLRYHLDNLIIRLHHKPDSRQLRRLNLDFSDIIVSGDMRLSGPVSVESDEPDLAHLHRLRFHFNRRNQGRLRMLIDRLNAIGK